jgi:hypothetical protein
MLKKLLVIAAGLALSAPVLADHKHKHHRGHHHAHQYDDHRGHHRHYQPHYHRPVVVMPPPRVVYYAPPPRPVYHLPAAPVYGAPAPSSGVSIRLHFPL